MPMPTPPPHSSQDRPLILPSFPSSPAQDQGRLSKQPKLTIWWSTRPTGGSAAATICSETIHSQQIWWGEHQGGGEGATAKLYIFWGQQHQARQQK